MKRKSSDTLVIFGSGSSINKINDHQWSRLSSYDSIGFNWFCHHGFAPTFYVIREQAAIPTRNVETETRKRLFKDMRADTYAPVCLIVHDMSNHSPHSYNYAKRCHRFEQDGIIVKDIKGKLNSKQFAQDIFKKGVFHGKCTMTNVLHIALYLRYKKLLFAGVDLRNSRYFWMHPKAARINIASRNLKSSNRHPVAKYTMVLLRRVKKHFDVEMSTMNRKSLLAKIMPYEDLR
jgi:hypothetical protein